MSNGCFVNEDSDFIGFLNNFEKDNPRKAFETFMNEYVGSDMVCDNDIQIIKFGVPNNGAISYIEMI